ncbi:DNA phosphorothioation system sulfurtransferase DndC [Janthinobacterium sp. LB2P70]|uniref:DNA phosphorothioation system sulfurtransferase DndC n=1 Tax=Janthinobacterium sp. LB2P70 TaxID=3424197 RepID=UPI003F2895E8
MKDDVASEPNSADELSAEQLLSDHLTESTEDRWALVVKNIREDYLDESQRFPWIIGFSGGKDSTLVVHATIDALMSIPPSRRTRPIHVVSNDTLVESPVVIAHLDKVTKAIRKTAENLELPIIVARTTPNIEKSFWVLLIGKGYPSPNQTMRWCTDRLKIQPTSDYIKKYISESGAAIVVLGVRRDESISRQRSVDKHRNARDSRLSPHSELLGALIYRPIVDLSTDDVWELLGTHPAPWGGAHTDLFQLYRDADGGECPVVLSKEEAPGCGTPNSRFGCWTCTVVEKDKSLQGFIDIGNHQYRPLVEFRDWLKQIRNKSEHRQAYRRNGRLTFDGAGKHIPGPFTIQTRKLILERLIAVQDEFGDVLISDKELDLIYQNWTTELQQQKGSADG